MVAIRTPKPARRHLAFYLNYLAANPGGAPRPFMPHIPKTELCQYGNQYSARSQSLSLALLTWAVRPPGKRRVNGVSGERLARIKRVTGERRLLVAGGDLIR